MSQLHFQTIVPAAPPTALPVRIEQSSTPFSTVAQTVALAVLALLIAAPFAMLLVHLPDDPTSSGLLAEKPGSVARVALGLALWCGLLGWPAGRLLARLGRRRTVTISAGLVAVTEDGPLGRTLWSEPVDRYLGIAHHIRSSVSGNRHELILVHPDRRRSVLLAAAARITQAETDAAAFALAVVELPARALYERNARSYPVAVPTEFHSQAA